MSERRGFPWLRYVILTLVIIVLGLSPLMLAIGAGFVAEANGCALNEGSVNTCMVGGEDWGEGLYAAFVLGWFSLATIPLGAMGLGIFALVLIIHLIMHFRTKRA